MTLVDGCQELRWFDLRSEFRVAFLRVLPGFGILRRAFLPLPVLAIG